MKRPVVLVGDTSSRKVIRRLKALGWGRMYVAHRARPYEGEPWGFDNGAYAAYLANAPFPKEQFVKRVERDFPVGWPRLAVLPDMVGQGTDSLRFSMEWREELPLWPWYLAVQDGLTRHHVTPHLNRIAGIFLGGTDSFKATAKMWCTYAHDHGKRFHYGRAGTLKKLAHAIEVGADSLDSAFPLWTEERFETFAHYWEHDPQGRLELE